MAAVAGRNRKTQRVMEAASHIPERKCLLHTYGHHFFSFLTLLSQQYFGFYWVVWLLPTDPLRPCRRDLWELTACFNTWEVIAKGSSRTGRLKTDGLVLK